MTKNIRIERLHSCIDCETCGDSYATGYVIYFDGVKGVEKPPVAHCYDDRSYDDEEMYADIFKYLGIEVETVEVKDEDEDE